MSSTPVPHEWETVPLRYVCQLNPSVDFSEFEEDDELTFLPMDRVKSGYFLPNTDKFSKYASSYNAFEEGDIVLAKVTPCFENGNIAVAQNLEGGKGFGSSELFVIRPKTVNRKFLFYYFQSSAFKQKGEASMTGAGGLKRVSPDLLRQHHLPRPDVEIQRLIADYLDRETARLDALVAEKEKMLALLEEKRAALISRAVTCGLDPAAPLKPSGLDWLGDIPAHWSLERLKFHLNGIEQGWSPQCENVPAEPQEWGVLKVGAVNDWTFNPQENKRLPDALEPLPEYAIKPRDVLMSRANTTKLLGSISMVEQAERKLLLCDKLYRLHINESRLRREYAVAYLRSASARFTFERDATGTSGSMQNIGQDTVINSWIPVPPTGEQEDIAAHIQQGRIETDNLRFLIQESLELLRERRAALITAAVTGQISVEEMSS